jgi:hypothetical protein
MHYRAIDAFKVVHYVDKVFYADVAGTLFAPWCELGQRKIRPPMDKCLLELARPRNQAVTCFFCLYLRHGVRRG